MCVTAIVDLYLVGTQFVCAMSGSKKRFNVILKVIEQIDIHQHFKYSTFSRIELKKQGLKLKKQQ